MACKQPTSEEGSIIKREWWKVWPKENIPDLMHVLYRVMTQRLVKKRQQTLVQ